MNNGLYLSLLRCFQMLFVEQIISGKSQNPQTERFRRTEVARTYQRVRLPEGRSGRTQSRMNRLEATGDSPETLAYKPQGGFGGDTYVGPLGQRQAQPHGLASVRGSPRSHTTIINHQERHTPGVHVTALTDIMTVNEEEWELVLMSSNEE